MALRDELQQTLAASYTIEQELGGGGMSRLFLAARLQHPHIVPVHSAGETAGVPDIKPDNVLLSSGSELVVSVGFTNVNRADKP
jgi:hypothetical protein